MLNSTEHKFELFIDKNRIAEIVNNLAKRINGDYTGKNPVFLIVLKGAVFFAIDLLKQIKIDCELEFISSKRYGPLMESDKIPVLNLFPSGLKNKDIIIVEDIIDTGITISGIIEDISNQEPKSAEVVALLSKPMKRKVDINIKYIGTDIPDRFVIGYGMDYSEFGRNMTDIYILKK
jgi:hypoxanthine phosphoribosyltransferase